MTVDSTKMELRLPAKKIKDIRAEGRKLAQQREIPVRALSRLVGKMNAASHTIPPAPLFFRNLQMAMTETLNASNQNYEVEVALSQDCLDELRWWDYHLSQWNGKSMLRKAVDLVIESDASLAGWGAVCNHQKTGRPWSREEQNLHINCLELLAATLALKTFTKGQTDLSVLLKMDNTTAVAYVNNQGGTVSRELVRLSKELWTWCLQRNITIKVQHLPGRLNQVANSESHTMLDRSDWKLDSRVFQQIHQTLGPNGGGFVCLQTDNTVPSLFQLAARSICSGNRCLPPSLDGAQGICKSAMEFGGTSGSTGSGSASLAGASSTCVEDPALVPNSTGDAGRCPTPDSPTETSNKSLTDENPSASRLAHIREKCRDHKLSEEASSLIFGSWREKTNKSYNSLFGRWHSWCSRRGTNPFSGPVTDVANFLAELFTEGYKYNSLNAHRSAISSVHEKVEG